MKVSFQITKINEEKEIEFKSKYSVLIDSLKETKRKKLIYFWKPFYLLRWGLTQTILIVLYDKPAF